MTIPIAHDFTCPWCWIGLFQAKQLKAEFGAAFNWVGYELYPEELEWPTYLPSRAQMETARPKISTRLELAYAAQQMDPPTVERPKQMRIHNALEAVEYAKTEGVADELVEKLYIAYWTKGLRINDSEVIANLAVGTVTDIAQMQTAIEELRFKDKIVGFDNPAYASGIYNVPTFTIDGAKYAEQPYRVLRKALGK